MQKNCVNIYVSGNNNNVNVVYVPDEVVATLQHSHEHIKQLQAIIDSKDRTIDALLQRLDTALERQLK